MKIVSGIGFHSIMTSFIRSIALIAHISNYHSRDGEEGSKLCPICNRRSVRLNTICSEMCQLFLDTYGDIQNGRYYYKVWDQGMTLYEMDVDFDLERPIKLEVKDGKIVREYGKWVSLA